MSAIEDLNGDTRSFSFVNQSDPDTGIDFDAGQFLTLKVDPNGDGLTAPRHYTIVSRPGDSQLQCAVKRVDGGVVSSYLHDVLKTGDTVQMSPPFGSFTPRDSPRRPVLVSAGIGITPMVPLAETLGDKVALVAHMDTSEATHVFPDRFGKLPTLLRYVADGTNADSEGLVKDICGALAEGTKAHDFYVCGPPGFQAAATKALRDAGAEHVYFEKFPGHSELPLP